jgi:hypothetical protein
MGQIIDQDKARHVDTKAEVPDGRRGAFIDGEDYG